MKKKVDYVKIQGHPNLAKDLETGAILKNDVSEIKQMIAELTKKMVEQNG